MSHTALIPPLDAPQPAVSALWDLEAAHCTLHIADTVHEHPTPVLHYMQPGLQMLTRRLFRNRVPTARRMEQAIMFVEAAVQPLVRLLPPNTRVSGYHPLLLDISTYTPQLPGATQKLTADALHTLLQRRLEQAAGSAAHNLPSEPQWAAALILAYEVLHHWQLPAMYLLPNAQPTPH